MTTTWNADIPALANNISADIPDIEENFQALHDIIEAITNGTLGTTAYTSFKVDTLADGCVDSAQYVAGSIDTEHIADANITAAKLASDICIKGWIQFDGTGTIAIADSYNVASITDNGTGDYTITWDTDFANDNYAMAGICKEAAQGTHMAIDGTGGQAVGTVRVTTSNNGGDGAYDVAADSAVVCLIAIGDQ